MYHRTFWNESNVLRFRNGFKEGVYATFCYFAKGFKKNNMKCEVFFVLLENDQIIADPNGKCDRLEGKILAANCTLIGVLN
jgi:hypothetical protein